MSPNPTDKRQVRAPRSFQIADQISSRTGDEKLRDKDAKTGRTSKARKPMAMNVTPEVILQSDEAVNESYKQIDDLTPPLPAPYRRPRFGWGKLALSAFSVLIAFAVGLAIDTLIRDLFNRSDWLGWTALGFAAIGGFAFLVVVARELWAISRLKELETLRVRAAVAVEEDSLPKARSVVSDISALFAERPDTARGRALLSETAADVMDGADLVHLLERDIIAPLDKTARAMVMASAKRVSVVTAVSPRAIVDIGYVLYENMRLIRNICEHYGGRPGAVSSLKLAREVLTHLVATGAIAVGDGLLQQVIGQGLASRLSARLGEGVVNGLLTARIGIAAIDVCRPLKFDVEMRPGISDFLSELANFRKSANNS